MNFDHKQFVAANRPFSRMQNLTFGPCMATVRGVCEFVGGAYFVFSVL